MKLQAVLTLATAAAVLTGCDSARASIEVTNLCGFDIDVQIEPWPAELVDQPPSPDIFRDSATTLPAGASRTDLALITEGTFELMAFGPNGEVFTRSIAFDAQAPSQRVDIASTACELLHANSRRDAVTGDS